MPYSSMTHYYIPVCTEMFSGKHISERWNIGDKNWFIHAHILNWQNLATITIIFEVKILGKSIQLNITAEQAEAVLT